MKVKIVRIMALFGAPSSILGALMIYLSTTMTPGWSMDQSIIALSGEGFSAVIFQSGLLMAGSMAMIFSAGLFEFNEGELFGKLGSGGVLLYGLTVSALGISIVNLGGVKTSIVGAALLLVPVSLALLAVSIYKKGLTAYAVLTGVAALFSVIPWVYGEPVTATQELMILVPFSIWQLVMGLHMYRLEVTEDEEDEEF